VTTTDLKNTQGDLEEQMRLLRITRQHRDELNNNLEKCKENLIKTNEHLSLTGLLLSLLIVWCCSDRNNMSIIWKHPKSFIGSRSTAKSHQQTQ
jgi:hypothetical protein